MILSKWMGIFNCVNLKIDWKKTAVFKILKYGNFCLVSVFTCDKWKICYCYISIANAEHTSIICSRKYIHSNCCCMSRTETNITSFKSFQNEENVILFCTCTILSDYCSSEKYFLLNVFTFWMRMLKWVLMLTHVHKNSQS